MSLRCLVSLAVLAVWQPPPLASGCHFTDITIRNGTWCCGAGGAEQRDTTEKNVTLPPAIPPAPPPPPPSSAEPTITTTTTSTTTTVTDTTTTPAPPRPPVGDCPCGNQIKDLHHAANEDNNALERVLSQNPDALKTLHRPWLVKIIVRKDSGVKVECSGSLLNKRYIITAAHCLCGTVVKCNPEVQSSNKVFSAEREPNLKRIKLVMGGGERNNGSTGEMVSKVIVHPDYYQYSGETVIGQTDVALIKTDTDLFRLSPDGTRTNDPKVEPICLPPKTGFMMDKNSSGVHEPFEDLDCKLIHENIRQVPYPYKLSTLEDTAGWLSCHPGGFAHGADISIEGRNSFITAYGSTAREDLDEKVRYQCSTNSYGPEDSILRRCDSKCHKTLKEKVEINLGEDYGRTEIERGNPSLAADLCAAFRDEKLQEAIAENAREMAGNKLDSQGFSLDEKFNFLGWIKIIDDDNKEVMCYPHLHSEGLDKAREMWDMPYKHGWCEVCQGPNMTEPDCTPSPDSGWGWCQPQCDEDRLQDPIDDEIREAAVDAFVFEDCSRNVNLYTEFCTAAPITSGFGQVWRYFYGNETWLKIKNEVRTFHKTTKMGDIDDPAGHAQHTSNIGDVCYGDAGGSVWKYWMFRAPEASEDKRVHKLAVLTGVVSRFEEHCGDIYSRLPSIHTRVSGVLDWINSVIGDGKCGAGGDKDDNAAAEQRIYSNDIDSSEFYEFKEEEEIGSEEAREGRVQGPILAEESDLDEQELDMEPFAPYVNWT